MCDLPVWCSGNGLFAGFGISLAPAKLLVYNYFGDGGANGSLEILLVVVVVGYFYLFMRAEKVNVWRGKGG